ncbi:hypothetical protein DRQ09_08815, partial [candidate division KSB1 bacterium]
FRKNFKYLFFIILFLFIFCEQEQIKIDPLALSKFLELNEGQKAELIPVFEQVKQIFNEYYRNKNLKENTNKKNVVSEIDEDWINTLDKVFLLIKDIPEKLNSRQKLLWSRTKLYRLFIYERSEIIRKIMSKNKERFRVEVKPTLDPEFYIKGFKGNKDLYRKWTVTFGSGQGLYYRRVDIASVKKKGRYTFPITVVATLVDPEIMEYEFRNKYPDRRNEWDILRKKYLSEINPDNDVLVRVSLFTSLHPKFVDIKNWIVYLEDNNNRQIEPEKVVERKEPWKYYEPEVKIPEFAKGRTLRGLEPNRQFQRGGELPLKSNVKMENYSSYYLLYFPSVFNGSRVIGDNVEFLKLVFLKDIGSNEKAEGIWIFVKK